VLAFAVAVTLSVVASVSADDNVREVQEKLRDGGFYTGEINGAYSSQLSTALTRYQIRNGLPITGQLDVDTSKALGAKPAVTTTPADSAQSSDTWRRLRKGERQTVATTTARERSSARTTEIPGSGTGTRPRSAPAAKTRTSAETTEPASAPPATARTSAETTEPVSAPPSTGPETSSPAQNVITERLRDYVGAFVLAGLDPHIGAEADFFADRVHYYDQGVMSREQIREDLKRYAERWPERRFWLAGDIKVESENGNRVRVTFPLRYELRNASKDSSGKIDKTLVLEPAGDDLEIVAVNERKAD
jgi:peptidoglycan hydrolase-like protein with peptidoglycan-binding domain